MSVSSLLRKEKDGSLFHEWKQASSMQPQQPQKVLPGGAVRPPTAPSKAVPTPHVPGIKRASVGDLVNEGKVRAHNWPLTRDNLPALQPPLGADQKAPPEETTQPTAQDDGTMKIQCDLRWYAAAADELCKIACGLSGPEAARALAKLAEVTPEEAMRSLEQAEALEKAKPTVGQVARYGALGAVVAPTVSIGREMLRKGPKAGLARYFKDVAGPGVAGQGLKKYLQSAGGGSVAKGLMTHGRHMAGDMAAGAVTSGALPLVRAALDRRAAARTMRHFLEENAPIAKQIAPDTNLQGQQ